MAANTDDYDEIVRAMQLYLDAYNENNFEKLKEAFHEDAWIFFFDAGGTLHKGVMRDRFEERVRTGGLRQFLGDVVGRIVCVTQAGNVAAVQLNFDSARDKSNCWIDFHNLLRINGAWKIRSQ